MARAPQKAMPIFEYKALTAAGRTKKGIIDADTAREARDKLRHDRMHVTDMRRLEEEAAARARAKGGWLKFRMPKIEARVNIRELAINTRQFSVLLASGIHLSEAISALVEQATDRGLEKVFRDLREKIASGSSLADALSKHPRYFNELYVNMVRAGEASGDLDRVLARLADYLQKQASLRGKVAAAMTYPAVMVLIGTGVVVFLMSVVVPKITEILIRRGEETLPWVTVTLMGISDFLKAYWWLILAVGFGIVVFYRLFVATERGRLIVDTYLLQMPIFGILFKKAAISRFAVTLSTLLKSGLPALDSLRIVSRVVNNARISGIIDEIAERIVEGADISTPIKRSKVFPPMIGYMVAVGEQSGELEEVLDRVSTAYEEEIDLAIQRITALIEPVIIVLLAVVVGFIILAVLLPLLQLSKL